MKIVNMKKFLRSIILIVIFLFLITIVFSNRSLSHNDISYKKIYVSSGDTLWTIAKNEKGSNDYFENKDIREIIYELKNINNLENTNLKIGQELNIPSM